MNARERFLLGGIGGLVPVLAFLASADLLDQALASATPVRTLGYLLRGSAMFVLGGLIAWCHTDEDKPYKILQIGIAAPALVAGIVTTAQLDHRKTAAVTPPSIGYALAFVSPAAAQPDRAKNVEVKQYRLPAQDQFWEGLIGKKPTNVWFVTAGSHKSLEDAMRQLEVLRRTYPQFPAEIYEPQTNPYYAVVIGAYLTRTHAIDLRDRARAAGLKPAPYASIPGAFLRSGQEGAVESNR